ncbi:MAG: GDP-mannose 4,6-dehydratase [Oscillospiraceae bacterium]|nr:GDP-mannose 4,6-dehydratase [Oscillospiraceae bacterium]MCL2278296.1 GDP-mannose 4,6-dehydratase [Oscillospiraceae bacterium]
MKALITGSNGFVGRHLEPELQANGYTVYGLDIVGGDNTDCIDLLNQQSLKEYVLDRKPDVIFHLAAQANVGLSWKIPQKTYEVNVIGTINLLEAVKELKSPCRIVLVGSADQYGVTGIIKEPISENAALNAQNPYAASKKAQEELSRVYAKTFDMDIVLTRSFNHSGPGQGLGYLTTDLCHGIVQVEQGKSEYLKVGNLEVVRDFSDVRDIVRAYRLLAGKGDSGQVYNVGSGTGRKAQDILNMLISMSKSEIPVRQDESRMRPSDTPTLICDNTRLMEHTGWRAEIPIETTLQDVLEFYRVEGVRLK